MTGKWAIMGLAWLAVVTAVATGGGAMSGPAVASPISSRVEGLRAVCGPRGCAPANRFAGRPTGSTRPHYFGGYTRPHYFGGYARSRHSRFGYTRPHYFGEHTRGLRTW
jgi:hypothetical protein